MRRAFAPLAAAVALSIPGALAAQAMPVADGSAFGWVDTVFREYADDGPGCAVGAARHGRPLFERAYGMADVAAARAATPSTVYGIASVAKQFTAMSVVLLAQDGRLALDDDVRRWIPELPDYGWRITLRHLLTHTSGVRDYMNLLAMQRGGSPEVTDADALAIVVQQRALNFAPGTDWAYSNSGYLLLAEVVRRASGRPLPTFARERILAPLELRATTFGSREQAPDGATGHAPTALGWAPAYYPVWTTGSGNMYSTVGDLLRWAEALRTGRVGGTRAVQAMETVAALHDGSPLTYGLGLQVATHRGARTVSHGGAGGGFRAELLRFPAQELAIAVLCNATTAPAGDLARRVADGLLRTELAAAEPPRDPPEATSAAAGDLARFAGVYVGRAGQVRTFFVDSGALRLRVPPGVVRRLVPLGAGRVRVANTSRTFHFSADSVRTEGAGEPPAVYHRVGADADTAVVPSRYLGRYASADLGVTWEVVAGDDGALRIAHGGPRSPERAQAMFRDGFMIVYGLLRFRTDCRGEVIGFTISEERVQGLRFDRVGSGPPAAACPERVSVPTDRLER
jgi:CubicO group peptidase (beta-lactamase class C family)